MSNLIQNAIKETRLKYPQAINCRGRITRKGKHNSLTEHKVDALHPKLTHETDCSESQWCY